VRRNALIALLTMTLALQAGVASAGATPLTSPLQNLPIGTLPASCAGAPHGAACTDAVVSALDSARASLGLGRYPLPANFDSLSGARQIFILANLDRIAYGLTPIEGVAPALAASAQTGVRTDADPNPTATLSALPRYAWTSDWAGGWLNAPYAYYEWMYDDGYAGAATSNVDCTGPAASGCWDHRRNLLAFAQPGTIAMGVAVGPDAHGAAGYAITLVWTPGQTWSNYSYTWAQANSASAGAPRRPRR
jgi:hypothetical protein